MKDCRKIVEEMGRDVINNAYEIYNEYGCRIGYQLKRANKEIEMLIDEFNAPGIDQLVMSKFGAINILKDRFELPEWFDETLARLTINEYDVFKETVDSVRNFDAINRTPIVLSGILSIGKEKTILTISTITGMKEEDVTNIVNEIERAHAATIKFFSDKRKVHQLKRKLKTFLFDNGIALGTSAKESMNVLSSLDSEIESELKRIELPPLRAVYAIDREFGSLIEDYFSRREDVLRKANDALKIAHEAQKIVDATLSMIGSLPSNKELVYNYSDATIKELMKNLDLMEGQLRRTMKALSDQFRMTVGERSMVGKAIHTIALERRRLATIDEFMKTHVID